MGFLDRRARKLIGYTLLGVSCIDWTLFVIVPFLPLETAVMAAWLGGLFIFGEITWWLAVPLLGKEFIEFIKRWWSRSMDILKNKADK
jgi:hypothetical protein